MLSSLNIIFFQPLDWSEVSEKIQEFREKFIDSTIVATEIEEQSMLKWLATLPFHTYDVREVPADGEPVQHMSGVRPLEHFPFENKIMVMLQYRVKYLDLCHV